MNVTAADRDLSKLEPKFQEQVGLALAECYRLGLNIFVTEAYRSQERQNYLYSLGRSIPGNIVTWTLRSVHTKGLAIDIAFRGAELYPDKDDERWQMVAEVFKKYGIDWGKDLWGVDWPHFQDNAAPWEKPPDTYVTTLPTLTKPKTQKALDLMKDLPELMFGHPHAGVWGTYNRFKNLITIQEHLPGEDKSYTAEHEWGHFIWHWRLSKRTKQLFERAVERTGYSPTTYGKKNVKENWAECYAQILTGRTEYEHKRFQHRAALASIQRFERLKDQTIWSRMKDVWQ